MIVLYPVLVLSIIAGNGLVFAEDAPPGPARPAANAAPAAPNAAPAATAAPAAAPAANAAPSEQAANAAPKANAAPTTAEQPPRNIDGPAALPALDLYDKEKTALTLDRITKSIDADPTPGTGTGAVPLVSGKNYDFLILKLPKNGAKPLVSAGRNLDEDENSNEYPIPSNAQQQPQQHCPCQQVPQQLAPSLNALQGIYGNALSLNAIIDPNCPAGMVQVYPNTLVTNIGYQMLPAIDAIPSNDYGLDFNSMGSPLPDPLYSQNGLLNYQQPDLNHKTVQTQISNPVNFPEQYALNGYNPLSQQSPQISNPLNFPGQYPQNACNPLFLQSPQICIPLIFPGQYPQNGYNPLSQQSPQISNPLSVPVQYPQNGYNPLPQQSPQISNPLNVPGQYPQNGYNPLSQQSPQIGNHLNFPAHYPQNAYNPLPYQSSQFGDSLNLPGSYPQTGYNTLSQQSPQIGNPLNFPGQYQPYGNANGDILNQPHFGRVNPFDAPTKLFALPKAQMGSPINGFNKINHKRGGETKSAKSLLR